MMKENHPITNNPIVEGVIDIDCDLPLNTDLQSLRKAAGEALQDRYPRFRQQLIQEHVLTKEGDAPPEVRVKKEHGVLQFLAEDEKQLVQFRPNGFSFNRLAPYGSLDEYMQEIESAWKTFLQLAQPVTIRKISIRIINRIMLPLDDGKLEFGNFLMVGPKLPDTGSKLGFLGFLDQQMALDADTGNHVNIVKTMELPQGRKLPLILDIDAYYPCEILPTDWHVIQDRLDSLRSLKNRIFRNTLTEQCLNLFSQQG